MKVLHLTLKKKWFDMIASGEKKEEYRQWKPYWAIRLLEGGMRNACAAYAGDTNYFKKYDIVRFKNGYGLNAPVIDVECKGIILGHGKYEWGATGRSFIIKLGAILSVASNSSINR